MMIWIYWSSEDTGPGKGGWYEAKRNASGDYEFTERWIKKGSRSISKESPDEGDWHDEDEHPLKRVDHPDDAKITGHFVTTSPTTLWTTKKRKVRRVSFSPGQDEVIKVKKYIKKEARKPIDECDFCINHHKNIYPCKRMKTVFENAKEFAEYCDIIEDKPRGKYTRHELEEHIKALGLDLTPRCRPCPYQTIFPCKIGKKKSKKVLKTQAEYKTHCKTFNFF
jgi:hypothetical protein